MTATRDRAAAGGTTRGGTADVQWLDLDDVTDVAIVAGGRRIARVPGCWSADSPGKQMIEIRFHHRTPLRRLRIVSSEVKESRTQEPGSSSTSARPAATEEVEDYALQLEEVSTIQLRIVPSIDGRPAVARVTELRVASA